MVGFLDWENIEILLNTNTIIKKRFFMSFRFNHLMVFALDLVFWMESLVIKAFWADVVQHWVYCSQFALLKLFFSYRFIFFPSTNESIIDYKKKSG